jgi:hypothetical protein
MSAGSFALQIPRNKTIMIHGMLSYSSAWLGAFLSFLRPWSLVTSYSHSRHTVYIFYREWRLLTIAYDLEWRLSDTCVFKVEFTKKAPSSSTYSVSSLSLKGARSGCIISAPSLQYLVEDRASSLYNSIRTLVSQAQLYVLMIRWGRKGNRIEKLDG